MKKGQIAFKTEAEYKEAIKLAKMYNNRYAAEVYGVHPRTIRKWKQKYGTTDVIQEDFTVEEYSIGVEPIEDLIANRIKKFNIRVNHWQHFFLLNVVDLCKMNFVFHKY